MSDLTILDSASTEEYFLYKFGCKFKISYQLLLAGIVLVLYCSTQS